MHPFMYSRTRIFRSPADAANAAPAASDAPAAAPSTEAAPAAPSADAAPADRPLNSGTESADSLMELMQRDPFGPAPTPTTPTTQTAPAAAPTQQTPAAAPAPAAPAAPQTPAPSEVELLRTQVAELRGKLDGVSQTQQTQTSAQQPPDELPPYEFAMPEPLQRMLTSDDPAERLRGTGHLVQGVSRAVHQQVVTQVRNEFATVIPGLVQHLVGQNMLMQQVKTDFYGKFPQYDRPELREMINAVGKSVLESGKYKNWGSDIRDEIGARVAQVLSGVIPAPAAAAPAAPAFTAPTAAARPGVPAATTSVGQHFMEMMGG